MKYGLKMIAAMMLCIVLGLCGIACAAGDGMDELKARLKGTAGRNDIYSFDYDDYDGDGVHEAFVLLGETDRGTDGISGDLWFVGPGECREIQSGCSYLRLGRAGNPGSLLFTAEEWYGGSGSTTHIWSVVGGKPVAVDAAIYGDFEHGAGNEFYAYPSAFDAYSDGTGHTWKQYYYYLDGTQMREYGGMYIALEDLLMFDGAAEIIAEATSGGYSVVNVVYRSNGIINVNLQENGTHYLKENRNLSLRYDGNAVTLWNQDSGVYALASDPGRAVYPKEFVRPSGSAAQAARKPEPETVQAVPAIDGVSFSAYKMKEDEYYTAVMLGAFDASGRKIDEIQIESFMEDYAERADYELNLYGLTNGYYYVETAMRFDGVVRQYVLLKLTEDGFERVVHVEDPAYSDGSGLRDPFTYEDYIYVEDYGPSAEQKLTDALNNMFAGYGLHFTYPTADSIDGEKIFSTDKAHLGSQPAAVAAQPERIEGAFIQVEGAKRQGDVFLLDGDVVIRWGASGGVESYYLYLCNGSGNELNRAEGVSSTEMKISPAGMVPGEIYKLRVGAKPIGGTVNDIQWMEISMACR